MKIDIDEFFRSYIGAALWSSTDDDGNPLDDNYDVDDVAPETINSMRADCVDFIQANRLALSQYATQLPGNEEWSSSDRAGHDFWLTRNGHGCGFWDRGLTEKLGERLTNAAQTYGCCDLYIGDDNLIY